MDAPRFERQTKWALWWLLGGVVVGAARIAWRSHLFSFSSGRGALVDLLGCGFVALVLWTMLTLRSLAADGSPQAALDDGLTATGVAVWAVALVPPRPLNYLLADAANDFAYAYLPASLLAALLFSGVVAVWPQRTGLCVTLRLFAALTPVLLVLGALLRFASGGAGADAVALRAWMMAGASAVATAGLAFVLRRAREG